MTNKDKDSKCCRMDRYLNYLNIQKDTDTADCCELTESQSVETMVVLTNSSIRSCQSGEGSIISQDRLIDHIHLFLSLKVE